MDTNKTVLHALENSDALLATTTFMAYPRIKTLDIPIAENDVTVRAKMYLPAGLKEDDPGIKYPLVLHV